MEQWAQKPDKICEFYLRVVNTTYFSFSDEKNSLLHPHNLITFCTSTPPERDQRLILGNRNSCQPTPPRDINHITKWPGI